MIKWTNDVSASSHTHTGTRKGPNFEMSCSREPKQKRVANNADTSLFNRKPQLYTIIHSLQLSYIPSHSCFTASAGGPSAYRPPARRPTLLLALGQHWPSIYSHVIQYTKYIIIGVGKTLAQHIFISFKPSTVNTLH